MELIQTVKNILEKLELTAPIIDLHFDPQGHLFGYITDASFYDKTEEEAQAQIWGALKAQLGDDELTNIIAIFHETPEERVERVIGPRQPKLKNSRYWYHVTPEQAKYWMFIDVAKFGTGYKAFFLIISEKDQVSEGLTSNYEKEIIDYMELEQDEVYPEIFNQTYESAESDLMMHLMGHYEALTAHGLHGKSNMYWYVYENFELSPTAKRELRFTPGEISMLQERLKDLDDFGVKRDIEQAIALSNSFNQNVRRFG